MLYQELYDSVANLTNHPEMVGEITVAIQHATLKMHQSDFYVRDAVEKLVLLDREAYIVQLDIPTHFPRYRAVRWIRKWDPSGINDLTQQNTGAAGAFLEKVDPEGVIDVYGYTRPDRWYVAGSNLNLRSSTILKQLLMSYYVNPVIAPVENYSSWIADVAPFAIIFDAASLIFQTLAHNEQSRKYDALVLEQLQIVRMHGIDSKGF